MDCLVWEADWRMVFVSHRVVDIVPRLHDTDVVTLAVRLLPKTLIVSKKFLS